MERGSYASWLLYSVYHCTASVHVLSVNCMYTVVYTIVEAREGLKATVDVLLTYRRRPLLTVDTGSLKNSLKCCCEIEILV